MKKSVLIIACLLGFVNVHAQNIPETAPDWLYESDNDEYAYSYAFEPSFDEALVTTFFDMAMKINTKVEALSNTNEEAASSTNEPYFTNSSSSITNIDFGTFTIQGLQKLYEEYDATNKPIESNFTTAVKIIYQGEGSSAVIQELSEEYSVKDGKEYFETNSSIALREATTSYLLDYVESNPQISIKQLYAKDPDTNTYGVYLQLRFDNLLVRELMSSNE